MKLLYKNNKIKLICEDSREAKKYFGGNINLAISLLGRINALVNAETIMDIVVQPQFHFHKLYNLGKNKNLDGLFAIDVKSRVDKWRIILQPLDDNEQEFIPCNIDEIGNNVRIVKIEEVSNHYE
jgi:proteic killer suppression protein